MIDIRALLFVVDGPSEVTSFREKFGQLYSREPGINIASCNGKDVTPEAYANKTFGIFLSALRKHYRYIICIIDKESRPISTMRFAKQVKAEIIKKILSCPFRFVEKELDFKIKVCVPDIMFENWILADIKGIKRKKELIKSEAKQEKYEGKHGAYYLDLIMLVRYKKTIHAHVLFRLVSFDRAKINSNSFNFFYKCLHSCK